MMEDLLFPGTMRVASLREEEVEVFIARGRLFLNSSHESLIKKNTTSGNGGGAYVTETGYIDVAGYGQRTSITGNRADGDGGGVFVQNGFYSNGLGFRDNHAKRGGGLFVTGELETTISDSDFTGNIATEQGGGLYSETEAVTVDASYFIGNQAGSGGGLFALGNRIEVTEFSEFRENSAIRLGDGGGIYHHRVSDNPQPSSLSRALITDCTAIGSGGGIFLTGVLDFDSLSQCAVIACSAGKDGGGIAIEGDGKLRIGQSGIKGCTAAGDGGGIWAKFVELELSSVSENRASTGGGIYVLDEGFVDITGSTIGWNIASANGGGVGARNASAHFRLATIAENNAEGFGGGAYFGDGLLEVEDCIIAKNMAAFASDVFGEVGSLERALIGEIVGLEGVAGDSSEIIVDDPLLYPIRSAIALVGSRFGDGPYLEIPNGYFDLHHQSPAINAGGAFDGNESDQRWASRDGFDTFLRVIDGNIDLGAIEFQLVARDYESWAESRISDPSLREESADADGDGISNGLERLFGTNPVEASEEPLAFVESPEGLTLNYPLGFVPPGSDSLEWSTNLNDWERGLPGGAVRELSISLGRK